MEGIFCGILCVCKGNDVSGSGADVCTKCSVKVKVSQTSAGVMDQALKDRIRVKWILVDWFYLAKNF